MASPPSVLQSRGLHTYVGGFERLGNRQIVGIFSFCTRLFPTTLFCQTSERHGGSCGPDFAVCGSPHWGRLP